MNARFLGGLTLLSTLALSGTAHADGHLGVAPTVTLNDVLDDEVLAYDELYDVDGDSILTVAIDLSGTGAAEGDALDVEIAYFEDATTAAVDTTCSIASLSAADISAGVACEIPTTAISADGLELAVEATLTDGADSSDPGDDRAVVQKRQVGGPLVHGLCPDSQVYGGAAPYEPGIRFEALNDARLVSFDRHCRGTGSSTVALYEIVDADTWTPTATLLHTSSAMDCDDAGSGAASFTVDWVLDAGTTYHLGALVTDHSETDYLWSANGLCPRPPGVEFGADLLPVPGLDIQVVGGAEHTQIINQTTQWFSFKNLVTGPVDDEPIDTGDPGTDSGGSGDSGGSRDSAIPTDSGTTADSGTQADSGDPGTPNDTSDATVDPPADDPPAEGCGCSCSGSGEASAAALLVPFSLLVFGVARRRR